MYKLFLCLRYLRKRALAFIAVLAVALCVAMMLIAVSVMNGFLRQIEIAAKGLFGDIVIEPGGQWGLAHYDEFIDLVRRDVPEVSGGTPFILSGGMLRLPDQPGWYQYLQVAGIRLPQRAEVTDFERGLFVQAGLPAPTFKPPEDLMLRRMLDANQQIVRALRRMRNEPNEPAELRRVWSSYVRTADTIDRLAHGQTLRLQLKIARDRLREAMDEDADEEVIDRLSDEVRHYEQMVYEPDGNNHVILGLGIPGLSFRTAKGETFRMINPGDKVVLYVWPNGRQFSATDVEIPRRTFGVADDCASGVSSIDSEIVYMPFETMQLMNSMDNPPRCSQIHLKVDIPAGDRERLTDVARHIQRLWDRFQFDHPDSARGEVYVQTWRQRQKRLLEPIEAQRTLVVIMFGIMSLVSVVLIFAIFYMIVVQKTREIGIVKSVGASSGGVATIFLGYGAAVGLVGAVVGVTGGWLFVHYINPIHDWVGRTFGLVVWDRTWFMFDQIPNHVNPAEAAGIVAWAVASGLLGALVPAIVASLKQPVEALRYE